MPVAARDNTNLAQRLVLPVKAVRQASVLLLFVVVVAIVAVLVLLK